MTVPRAAVAAFSSIPHGEQHVITIGNFDGVHRGHQHLLNVVRKQALTQNLQSIAITFEPHPIAILRPEMAPGRIVNPLMKRQLLMSTGIDYVVTIPFDLHFAEVSAIDFLMLLFEQTCPAAVVVGEDFGFGRRREGTIEMLKNFAEERGFQAILVAKAQEDGQDFSSSRIRADLQKGAVEESERLLGHRYRLTGQVEHGLARGKEIGYPTANLDVAANLIVPADGIYAGYARVKSGQAHQAMIYIGKSPTFDESRRTVEAHLLNFRRDLYAQELEIEFVAHIRGDQEFQNVEELIQRIDQDEVEIRDILRNTHPEAGNGAA